MIVAGLGLTHAIASEPTTPKTKHTVDVCRQAGADYTQLYTIEEETRSITICQKGSQYYYVTTPKK